MKVSLYLSVYVIAFCLISFGISEKFTISECSKDDIGKLKSFLNHPRVVDFEINCIDEEINAELLNVLNQTDLIQKGFTVDFKLPTLEEKKIKILKSFLEKFDKQNKQLLLTIKVPAQDIITTEMLKKNDMNNFDVNQNETNESLIFYYKWDNKLKANKEKSISSSKTSSYSTGSDDAGLHKLDSILSKQKSAPKKSSLTSKKSTFSANLKK